MAGDWITIKTNLVTDIKFSVLMSRTGFTQEKLFITLCDLASWFGKYSKYGQMSTFDASAFDLIIKSPGFLDSCRYVDWVKDENGSTRILGFCLPPKTRKSLGKTIREKVLSAGRCKACGSSKGLVIDHDIPISRGGTSSIENLQCLCSSCNRLKFKMTMAEFLVFRSRKNG